MTGEVGPEQVTRLFMPDGTTAVLDILRNDPGAIPVCMFNDDDAVAIVATPEGITCQPDVRVAGLCPQHIVNEWPQPMVALVGLHIPDFVEEHLGEPVFKDRAALEEADDYAETVATILESAVVEAIDVPDRKVQRSHRFLGFLTRRTKA